MKKISIWAIIVLMSFATAVLADWSRDITYQTAEPTGNFAYLGVQGIHDGPVVADAVPTWAGEEVLQATRTSILIMSADNQQTPLELAIPIFNVDCEFSADGNEFIASQPAVGDVDNDGDNDIVVGITFKCERQLDSLQWLLDYYGSVVWWTWNGSGFDQHSLRLEDAGVMSGFLGTPAICRTEWTNSGFTVAFWGPSSLQVTPSHDSWYVLTAFDLSDPQQPGVMQASGPGNTTSAQVTWARGSGIYVQAADLTSDGYDELIAHNDRFVYRFDWNGSSFSGSSLYTVPDGSAFQSGHGVIADVDANGDLEYLVSYSTLLDPPTSGRLVQIDLSGVGQPVYGDVDQNIYPITGTQPCACDLSCHPASPESPEGRLSPIITTRGDSRMYNSAAGALRSGAWPILQLYYPNDQRNVSNPALAYVTGSTVQPQFIKVDIGRPPNVGDDEIRVYDPITGDEVYSADLSVPSLYTYDAYSSVTSSPVYCDLDGSGQGSIITSFRTSQDTLLIFRTDPGFGFHPELAEWSQIEGGPKHKGLYAQPVSGNQPLTDMTWSERMIVHGNYTVQAGQTLTIDPGTVVEFRPNAYMLVLGTLNAVGTEHKNIYFKRDGTTAWNALLCVNATAQIEYCDIEGCGTVYVQGGDVEIKNSKLHNLQNGLDAYACTRDNLHVEYNTIENCTLYGIFGSLSSGTFSDNTISGCGRAGIYWVGDAVSGLEPSPLFQYNTVTNCADDLQYGIAGAYFNSTTAELKCNNFWYNENYQILCENSADVVMNGNGGYTAANNIKDYETSLYCNCRTNCNCPDPLPAGYSPLFEISRSLPHITNGSNTFSFDVDGTYIRDACLRGARNHDLTNNCFISNGQYVTGLVPSFSGHFCGQFVGTLNGFCASCFHLPTFILNPREQAYKEAVESEIAGDYTTAEAKYTSIIDEYPESSEAQWSLHGYNNSVIVATSDPLAAHANLTGYYNDNELPAEMRNAAKREAIWAKVIGHYYTDALTELAEITDDPDHADNLWAEQMTAIVEFLNEPPTTFSTGNRVPDRSRLTTLHDRIQILNGRHTDQEVLDAPPVVESHRLSKAFPNPFNSSVNIQLALPTNGLAKVEVFNIMGQKVATLIDKPVNAGTQILRWDAANMASGVYVYHLQFENHHESGKLLLLK